MSPTPEPVGPDRPTGPPPSVPDCDGWQRDPRQAQQLWDALNSARAKSSPTVSIAVGAVFRFYLPLAHTLAHGQAQVEKDPALVERAAELGLAEAVLAWWRTDSRGFTRVAGAAIQDRLRQIPAANAQPSPETNPPPTPARPTTGP